MSGFFHRRKEKEMLQIKGKVNTAICFARVVEDEAIEQIRRMCDTEMTRGSQIRIMPDVHAGKGCTIGTTMTITDKAVPNVVGVDIGCGMYTVKLGKVDIDFEKVDEACHIISSGFDTWESVKWSFDLTELRCYRELENTKRLNKSLGTLGGGNHFIEIDAAEDGTKYLVIHSGSRNLGKQVAEYYQQLAIDLNHGKEEYFAKRDQIIEEYKATGRKSEIQAALKSLKWERSAKPGNHARVACWHSRLMHARCQSLLLYKSKRLASSRRRRMQMYLMTSAICTAHTSMTICTMS